MMSRDASMRVARAPTDRVPSLAAGARHRTSRCIALAVALACGLGVAPARAERADRDKPTYIESDRLNYDEPKQTTEFFGRVVLTRGTLVIRGDYMQMRQFGENEQVATARGKPATFRQKRDGPGEQYVDGSAQQLDYDSRNEKLVLTGGAVLNRTECGRQMDRIAGAVIVYDGRSETFAVDGGAPSKPTAGDGAGGRVRVTIQPRSDSKGGTAAANPCPPSEPARLKTDPRIGP